MRPMTTIGLSLMTLSETQMFSSSTKCRLAPRLEMIQISLSQLWTEGTQLLKTAILSQT